MIEFKAKIWLPIGAAIALSAGAACTPPQTETEKPTAAMEAEAGEAAIGETGGEAGEAGAVDAYAGLEGPAAISLRLQHLKGFLLAADALRKAGLTSEAQILIEQGDLELARNQGANLGGLQPTVLVAAAAAAAANDEASLKSAIAALTSAQAVSEAAPTMDTVRRLLSVVRGVYGEAVTAEMTDPVEYQHSYAAALAARDALDAVAAKRSEIKPARMLALTAEMDALLKLWPGPTAPEKPIPATEVAAQTSRVELALSGL